MHRSGTSCLAGLLNTMGAYYSDDEHAMPIAVDNPKGFFERSDVCKLLQELLVGAGADWHRVCGLDARLPTVVATPPSPA